MVRASTLMLALAAILAATAIAGCTTAVTQGTIEGTVFDEGQSPVAGAWVTVSQSGSEYARVPTDSAGKYKVTSLVPGTYDAKASPPSDQVGDLRPDGPYPVNVRAGGTSVRNFYLLPVVP